MRDDRWCVELVTPLDADDIADASDLTDAVVLGELIEAVVGPSDGGDIGDGHHDLVWYFRDKAAADSFAQTLTAEVQKRGMQTTTVRVGPLS
jgi:hypothetical protein